MKRFPSIKKNIDFRTVYEKGKSKANRSLVMYVLYKEENDKRPCCRIGISTSKKIGNSVVRHHMARLLRETFRLHRAEVQCCCDIVVVVRAAAVGQSFHEIERSYLHLLQLHGLTEKHESVSING